MQNLHSPVRRASRRAQIPDTTSRRCGRRLASAGPQEPGTVRKKIEKVNLCTFSGLFKVRISKLRDSFGTSGVPQKVVVVLLSSRPSLQRPKSVRTMWPCESNRMFSGFRSLFKKIKSYRCTPMDGFSRCHVSRDPQGGTAGLILTCTRCAGSGGSRVHLQFRQRRTWLWAPGRSSPSGDGRRAAGEETEIHDKHERHRDALT